MQFPNIDPIAFEIGPFILRWYSLAYMVGFLFGWRYLIALAHRPALWGGQVPYNPEHVENFVPWITLGVILGGRLGYVFFYNADYYLANPSEILAIWQGGMSFHGGLIGVILTAYIFTKYYKISFMSWCDLMGACAPVGLFFGRIANFINGELWGRPSDAPWAVVFPGADDLPRHPSQLYEAGLEGFALMLVITILIFKYKALTKPGLISGVFIFGYGLSRFAVEFVREPDAHLGFIIGIFSMGQLLSLPLLILGLCLIGRAMRNAK